MAFLAFDQRVLELARDPAVPLLERVRFLSISCGNLDEFYEIRVAGLRQRLAHARNRLRRRERGAGARG